MTLDLDIWIDGSPWHRWGQGEWPCQI